MSRRSGARALLAGAGVAAAVAAVSLAAGPAAAQSRCTSQKLAGGGAYFSAFAKCLSKGLAKGTSPDPLCVAKAQTKLASGFARAEKRDDCGTIADLAPVQDVLDDALPDLLETVDPPPPVCCAFSDACLFTADSAGCTTVGGTAGAAGTFCSGSGTCEALGDVESGPCCATTTLPPEAASQCVGGLLAIPTCNDPDEVLTQGRCHPVLGCIPAGEVRSRCSAAKLKAAGAYFNAVAKCEARGAAKGMSADLVCLGRAQSKLQRAYEKAERKGDCLAVGDLSGAQQEADEGLGILFQILEAPPVVCCEGVNGCFWTESDAACELSIGATPGGPGTICGGDGACAPPPVPEGDCCQDLTIGGEPGRCAGGLGQVDCGNEGGSFVSDAVCLPAQLCID